MKQIMITLGSPEIQALEKAGDKSAITKVINLTVPSSGFFLFLVFYFPFFNIIKV